MPQLQHYMLQLKPHVTLGTTTSTIINERRMRNPIQSSTWPAPIAAAEEGRPRSGGRPGAGPTPCCSKVGLRRGPWAPEEDDLLSSYVRSEGEGRWRTLPKRAGLQRCGKSCRLRWMNYLRPSIKRGSIAADEEDLILRLHRLLGNRWSLIARRIPGRTDNEIKNYWNTHLSRKLISQGIDPRTHRPLASSPPLPVGLDVKSPTTQLPAPYTATQLISDSSGTPTSCSNATPAVRSDRFGRFGGFNNEELAFGTTAGDHGTGEGATGTDDTLTSFVDSLINEDFFLLQQQQQQQQQH